MLTNLEVPQMEFTQWLQLILQTEVNCLQEYLSQFYTLWDCIFYLFIFLNSKSPKNIHWTDMRKFLEN